MSKHETLSKMLTELQRHILLVRLDASEYGWRIRLVGTNGHLHFSAEGREIYEVVDSAYAWFTKRIPAEPLWPFYLTFPQASYLAGILRLPVKQDDLSKTHKDLVEKFAPIYAMLADAES